MKAAWFESFGAAREVLQVGEQPEPEPGAGEVRVALRTSGINPSDVKKRAGSMPELLSDGYVIPHSDGAGVIDAVGENVDPARVGERVWVYQAQHARRFGTAAEKVVVDGSRAATLPDATGFAIGACLGIPVMTAHRCVFAGGQVADQRLLITGGAGRVGHYAVQWASHAGARVIATASNDADAEACREAGASAVINHREADWSEAVLEATGGQAIDRVVDVDFGGNLEQVLNVIRVGGTIATYASMSDIEPRIPFYRMMFMDLTIQLVIVYDMPESAKLRAISDIDQALRSGWLKHRIAHRLPLEDIAQAHERIERGGIRGCAILDID